MTGNRREQAVLDLLRKTELGNHRQRHRLHGRQRKRERQHAGQQRRGVRHLDHPHLRKQEAEHHHQQQRLEHGAQQEEWQFPPGNPHVAPQHREEHVGGRERRLRA